jgi:hypothetical protein
MPEVFSPNMQDETCQWRLRSSSISPVQARRFLAADTDVRHVIRVSVLQRAAQQMEP